MLAHEGALFLKFMYFVSKDQNLKQMRKQAKDAKNGKKGTAAWKVSKEEIEIGKEFLERYDHAMNIAEQLLGATSTNSAPGFHLPAQIPATATSPSAVPWRTQSANGWTRPRQPRFPAPAPLQ